jgi:hypothetical protein
MDISLVTSLYRSQTFLEAYSQHVLDIAACLDKAGLALEMVLVANDPSEQERQQILYLKERLEHAQTAGFVLLEVPRETVYASWNRGVRASSGRCIGFWNIDDVRTAGALIEGHRLISDGCALVYFPYVVQMSYRVLGLFKVTRSTLYKALPYDREVFTRAMRGGSFWLFARELYDQVGAFDEHFKIAGDFEWCARAAEITDFCPATQLAGRFTLHGANLSDTGSPLQVVEDNIVHLRHGAWARLTPADPVLMRQCWEAWGNPGTALPEEVQDKLWGPGAFDRWQVWLRQERARRRRKRVSRLLRRVPRFVINHTGARSLLARLGLVKSATVDD